MKKSDFSILQIFEIPDLQNICYVGYLGFNANENCYQLLFLNKIGEIRKIIDITTIQSNKILGTREFVSEIQPNENGTDEIYHQQILIDSPYYIIFNESDPTIQFILEYEMINPKYSVTFKRKDLIYRSEISKEIMNLVPTHPSYNFSIFDPKKNLHYCVEGTNIYWNLNMNGLIYIYHILEHLQHSCLTEDDFENMIQNNILYYFTQFIEFQCKNSDKIDYDNEIKDSWFNFISTFTQLKTIANANQNQINLLYI